MCGILFDTKKQCIKEIEKAIQERYNIWLGMDENNDPLFKVKIEEIDPKCYKFSFRRVYGEWYGNPERYSDKDKSIFSYDKHIIIGDGWQSGTCADFSNFENRYIIRYGIDDFIREYKTIAKENHASRIRKDGIVYEMTDRDNINLTITAI